MSELSTKTKARPLAIKKPLLVVDAANSLLKIIEEVDGRLTYKIAPSTNPEGQTWETWDKTATFNSAIAPYTKSHEIVGTYAVHPHGKGKQFMESVVILQQRQKIAGLESAKALIDVGGGTVFSAILRPDGEAIQADFSDATGGVLIVLQDIATRSSFIDSVEIKSKSLSRISATQLGFILGCLGESSSFTESGDLDYRDGVIVIRNFLGQWGGEITERLNTKIVNTARKLQKFSMNIGWPDPIDESDIYLVGGGASLINALAVNSAGDQDMGISRYCGAVPAHYLNCYAAYLAAGGSNGWQ